MNLYTNRIGYANDIAEVMRLFLGNVSVQAEFFESTAPSDPYDFAVFLDTDADGYSAVAYANEKSYRFRLPRTEKGTLAVKRDEKRTMKIALFRLLHQCYDVKTPWGSLTGIRPTKLFRDTEKLLGHAGAVDLFLHTFDVSAQKTALAELICAVQAPVIDSVVPNEIDIYIGIPYCKSRCLYCSFGSLLAKDASVLEHYLDTLEQDILSGAELVRSEGFFVRSMYFGGGTPTVLSAMQLDRLLSFALNAYGGFGQECTVEAGRPDTIDDDKLRVIFDHGIKRISVNPQTMNDETLLRIGRAHTSAETEQAFSIARRIGFPVINMDLIVGLPGETLSDAENTLRRISDLSPDNLTVHTLALKRSSRLAQHPDEYPTPDAETVEQMVAMGLETASKLAMRPYYMYRQKYMHGNLENVGYAKPSAECVYNIDMMEETVSILAHGAGAMTKRVFGNENRIERVPNPKDVDAYRQKLPELIRRKFSLFSIDSETIGHYNERKGFERESTFPNATKRVRGC